MESDEIIIKPFKRINECNPSTCPKIKHFSCCNFEEYIEWRYSYIKPKLHWNKNNLTYEVIDDKTGEVVYFIETT